MMKLRDLDSIVCRIESCAFSARMDAQTLLVGADRTTYYYDVARHNKENIEELSMYVRMLEEEVSREAARREVERRMSEYGQVEETPFLSELVPF